MRQLFLLRRPLSNGLALLVVALGALQVVVAEDASPSMSAAARVSRLAQNVERAESVRAVKRVQETYAQYTQFGLWTDMAALFADNAQLSYGKDNVQGRQAIQQYFLTTFGEGRDGLKPGGLHTQLVFRPLINVSADGQTAKGRWWEFSMTGQHGVKAEWAGGIFENEYVREGGVWKISRMRYNPIFAGPYATGWRNVDEDQKIVPYHFTPDETGIPVPDLPAAAVRPVDPKMNPATTLATLEQRIAAMNEEDKVRNLQNAYGYYMDRKMWDDVTDLFTADGALSIAGVGVYDGPKSVRRALEHEHHAGVQPYSVAVGLGSGPFWFFCSGFRRYSASNASRVVRVSGSICASASSTTERAGKDGAGEVLRPGIVQDRGAGIAQREGDQGAAEHDDPKEEGNNAVEEAPLAGWDREISHVQLGLIRLRRWG